jgi:hypothetical protein
MSSEAGRHEMTAEVQQNDKITFTCKASSPVDGFVGNFASTIRAEGESTIEHGVAVIATGAQPLEPDEYGYGTDPRIITSLELDRGSEDDRTQHRTRPCSSSASAAGNRAALLQPGLLHPFGGQRPAAQKAQPGDERLYPVPGYAHLRRAGIPLQGGPRKGVIFIRYDLDQNRRWPLTTDQRPSP